MTVATVLGVLSVAAAPAPARAQEGGIVLEGGTARSLPTGVGLDPATYAMGGARLAWRSPRGSVSGGAYGGRATAEAGSDFLSGFFRGEFWLPAGEPVALGVGGMAQAFAVREPFLYRVSTAEFSPMVRFGSARAALVIRGRVGAGSSRVELRRTDGAVRRAEHDLWSRGIDAELALGSSDLTVTATAGVHRSQGGSFRGIALRALAMPGLVTLRGGAELWDTPLGTELSGGFSLSIAVGHWEVRASADRTGPDPLTLVEPGRQTGLLVGVRLLSFERGRLGVVHEVVRDGSPSAGASPRDAPAGGLGRVAGRLQRLDAGAAATQRAGVVDGSGDGSGHVPLRLPGGRRVVGA